MKRRLVLWILPLTMAMAFASNALAGTLTPDSAKGTTSVIYTVPSNTHFELKIPESVDNWVESENGGTVTAQLVLSLDVSGFNDDTKGVQVLMEEGNAFFLQMDGGEETVPLSVCKEGGERVARGGSVLDWYYGSDETNATLALSLSPDGLKAGTYKCQITFTAAVVDRPQN